MRDIILAVVDDLVSDFLYYDRKEDEDLPVGAINQTIENKDISIDEIVALFKTKLIEGLKT